MEERERGGRKEGEGKRERERGREGERRERGRGGREEGERRERGGSEEGERRERGGREEGERRERGGRLGQRIDQNQRRRHSSQRHQDSWPRRPVDNTQTPDPQGISDARVPNQ